mmetsp:Transcript_63924/g.73326  ORF Transcript_63924/g.73326 Transcript_63924/m.73326 type:complete len:356 (+) Transcript_63924:152-1219(+)
MYIGPWQEFRLAKVIEIKQRLASKDDELVKLRMTLQQLQEENRVLSNDRATPLGRKRQDSFSDRNSDINSVYSEPLVKRAPTFKTDDCYRNLERIDGNMTREDFLNTAFPDTALYQRPVNKSYGLPPRFGSLRKKKPTKAGRQEHQDRIDKMRQVFGIQRQGSGTNSEAATDINDDRMSQYSTSTAASTKTAPSNTHFPQLRTQSEPRKSFELAAPKPKNFSYFPKLVSNAGSATSSSRTSASSTRRNSRKSKKKRSASKNRDVQPKDSRFSSHQSTNSPEKSQGGEVEKAENGVQESEKQVIEEEHWERGVDNLLNWVEELPEELSTDSTNLAHITASPDKKKVIAAKPQDSKV